MTPEKEEALQEAYRKFIQAGFYDWPLDRLDDVFVTNVVGFGTNTDEKMRSIADVHAVLKLQREQAAGIEMTFDILPVFRRVSPGEDAALFVDEVKVNLAVDGEKLRMFIRVSSVFEYAHDAWRTVHIHASRPVETEQDSWQVNEWKKRTEELERLVGEKTSDLEEKNRELRIESSLERVRTQAMAMTQPADMVQVCRTIADELTLLDVREIRNVQTAIILEARTTYLNYEYFPPYDVSSISEQDYTLHPRVLDFVNAIRKSADAFFTASFEGKELERWRAYRIETHQVPDPKSEEATSVHYYFYSIGPGALGISTYAPMGEGDIAVFRRFRNVFDLAYRRFLDIQEAEAREKEARLEASLERVRAEALGMRTPGDLLGICEVLFAELRTLGFGALRNTMINIFNEERGSLQNYDYSDTVGRTVTTLSYAAHPLIQKQMQEMKGARDAFSETVFAGNDLEEWKRFRKDAGEPDDPRVETSAALHYYFYSIGTGAIGISTFDAIPEEERNILKRFRNVFDFAYRRYSDVAQAEAQAREAQIEVALERVRSRTLAMHKSDELAETAAILFQQLIGLGIAPNRLYIGIIKDESGLMELWATDEDGTRVGTRFTGDIRKSGAMRQMYDGWKAQKRSIAIDQEGEELAEYLHYLADELHVPVSTARTQQRRVQTIAYFSRGFLGIASPEPQPESTTALMERFAGVFNLTYTRFSDLQLAEAHAEQARRDLEQLIEEKQRAENALAELKATQAQLVQAEKMASLGELTAGVAHEIQNPLNFVNNFSESGSEIIDELKEELARGNSAEALSLADDVKQSLEKITHHGKRADAIVKGMLQHSRASTGVKEPTDINKLADEYLRLAYHGLRAKDKSFSATFATALDDTIGKVNVIPQDMGRVLLNLVNNAFYSVTEKGKRVNQPYEPTVQVSTKNLGGSIEIRVRDNGTGVPRNVLEKIFQPFFTTKPTGQGTGLGLSLSYDIIRGHAGELKVETEEGEFAEFIIRLPVLPAKGA
jgi:signal transduction histidine kinase